MEAAASQQLQEARSRLAEAERQLQENELNPMPPVPVYAAAPAPPILPQQVASVRGPSEMQEPVPLPLQPLQEELVQHFNLTAVPVAVASSACAAAFSPVSRGRSRSPVQRSVVAQVSSPPVPLPTSLQPARIGRVVQQTSMSPPRSPGGSALRAPSPVPVVPSPKSFGPALSPTSMTSSTTTLSPAATPRHSLGRKVFTTGAKITTATVTPIRTASPPRVVTAAAPAGSRQRSLSPGGAVVAVAAPSLSFAPPSPQQQQGQLPAAALPAASAPQAASLRLQRPRSSSDFAPVVAQRPLSWTPVLMQPLHQRPE